MSEMKEYTLQDCFSLRARIGWQGLRSDEFKTEGPYLVTGTDFDNGRVNWDNCYHVTLERYAQDKGIQLREHDLLITKDGTIGKTAVVTECPEKVTLNSGVFVVRAINNEVLPEYLHYILHSRYFDLFVSNVLTGSTIKHLNQEKFYKFTFAAPDVEEQRRIVEVLRAVDEAIDGTKRVVDKYRRLKDGVILDIIHTFDSLNFVRLGDCAELLNGDRGNEYPSASDIVSEGCAFINAGHMKNGRVDYERCDYITPQKFARMHGAKLKSGDILYCLRGTLGKNAYIREDIEGTVASSLVVIRAKNIDSEFLYYCLNSPIEEKQRRAADNGTAQPNLSAISVAKYKVPKPDERMQRQIVETLKSIDTDIENEKMTIQKLTSIKQGLLQDLLKAKK